MYGYTLRCHTRLTIADYNVNANADQVFKHEN